MMFTVEEMNLLCVYADGCESKYDLIAAINDNTAQMDEDMRKLAMRAIIKLDAMSDEEYAALSLCPAEEVKT